MTFRDWQSIAVLLMIGMISAVVLTFTARYAQPIIDAHKQKVLEESILKVLPTAEFFTMLEDDPIIYQGWSVDSTVVGYAFVGSGGGYQGVIKIMIGIEPNFEQLRAIEVIDNLETPGLGAKIMEPEFTQQFEGLTTNPQVTYVQNKKPERNTEIQAITGATISTQAVIRIINNTLKTTRRKLKTLTVIP